MNKGAKVENMAVMLALSFWTTSRMSSSLGSAEAFVDADAKTRPRTRAENKSRVMAMLLSFTAGILHADDDAMITAL
jgi:hypothetical protein